MTDPRQYNLAGVMGWPVAHSRSPMIHGYWIDHYGLSGAYVLLPVAPERLANALRGLAALGFAGCNVTIPHKVPALQLVDRVDAFARRIGAINTIVVERDGTLSGYNNDGFGYVQSLRDAQPDWRADAGPVVVRRAAPRAPWWRPGRCRCARDPAAQPHAAARARHRAGGRRGGEGPAVGAARRRVGGRRAARQHDEPGHVGPAAARRLPRRAAAARAGLRCHLRPAGDAAAGSGPRARQCDGQRAGDAAESGASGVPGVVRRDAEITPELRRVVEASL
jgi:hypothetical protein